MTKNKHVQIHKLCWKNAWTPDVQLGHDVATNSCNIFLKRKNISSKYNPITTAHRNSLTLSKRIHHLKYIFEKFKIVKIETTVENICNVVKYETLTQKKHESKKINIKQ